MKKIFSITFMLVIVNMMSFAQSNSNPQSTLTHHMSEEEKSRKDEIGKNFVETPPPTTIPRNIAEWENMQSVIITYNNGFGLPTSAITHISQHTNVSIIVTNSDEQTVVTQMLTSNGANMDNCEFIITPIDSWWARDYSPWFIYDGEQVAVVDFPYNRPRPNDDNIPTIISQQLSIPRYGMNLIQTGGNYMTDGYGNSAATELVVEENPSLSIDDINQKMHDYLGIENYMIINDPLGDYIKHIDCWGKFISPDKVVVGQVPQSDYRYEDYEAAAAYFANTNCAFGYPYKVYRVYTPGSPEINPYSNSLILNNYVYLPQSGSQWDDEALEVYSNAMPGYEIVPVLSTAWYNTDALHCRTHGIAKIDMLTISHIPYNDTVDNQDIFVINAEIKSYANNALNEDNLILHYSIDNINWEETILTHASTKDDEFFANINTIEEEYNYYYYITAEDVEGNLCQYPVMGEEDPFHYIIRSNVTSTNKAANNIFSLNIYPNPNSGIFFIWIDDNFLNNDADISVYNLSGNKVYNEKFYAGNNKNLKKLNLENFNKGVYFVKLTINNKVYTQKLLIK